MNLTLHERRLNTNDDFFFLCAHASETFKVPFSSDGELICIQPIGTSFPYLLITAHAFMVLTNAYIIPRRFTFLTAVFRSAQSYEAINEAEERYV